MSPPEKDKSILPVTISAKSVCFTDNCNSYTQTYQTIVLNEYPDQSTLSQTAISENDPEQTVEITFIK